MQGCDVKAVPKLIQHYDRLMYHALLTTIKASYMSIKRRVYSGGKGAGDLMSAIKSEGREAAFFRSEVEILTLTLTLTLIGGGLLPL